MSLSRPVWLRLLPLGLLTTLCVLAPLVAPNLPRQQFTRLLHAPPTIPEWRDQAGRWRAPFVRPHRLVNQLEQRYDRSESAVPLAWFTDGALVRSSEPVAAPLLWLGTDGLGRDVFSRLLFGGRVSLGLAALATLITLGCGGMLGAWAGYRADRLDRLITWMSDAVIALPSTYAALLLRALLPAVLSPTATFVMLTVILSVMAIPVVSRGVRGIVRAERHADYVVAARALGASTPRILSRHLLPSIAPFLVSQAALLLPAFVIAEATFSYVGLGFSDTVPTWGTMLQEAATASTLDDAPWLLSPVLAMIVVVLSLQPLGHRVARTSTAPPGF